MFVKISNDQINMLEEMLIKLRRHNDILGSLADYERDITHSNASHIADMIDEQITAADEVLEEVKSYLTHQSSDLAIDS